MTEYQRHDLMQFVRGGAFALLAAFVIGIFAGGSLATLPIYVCSFGIPFAVVMPLTGGYLIPKIRFRSFLATTAVRTVVWATALIATTGISLFALFSWMLDKPIFGAAVMGNLRSIYSSPEFWISSMISMLVVFSISSIYAVSRKLGPGVLANWIRGYYHNPREEERIFMFLDMKDSTMLAEKLGNLRFSSLVRDFFRDLTKPVIETRGAVSHYIGDEAVLTWKIADGLKNWNCVRCFTIFADELDKRAAEYRRLYGLVPGFKAGLHCGLVVATEVGEIKSEIVFHGDVLNAAARIQGLCNELGSPLLLSGELALRLGESSEFALELLGDRLLKGKEREVAIYRVVDVGTAASDVKSAEGETVRPWPT